MQSARLLNRHGDPIDDRMSWDDEGWLALDERCRHLEGWVQDGNWLVCRECWGYVMVRPGVTAANAAEFL